MLKLRKNKKGFTLVELIVVIAIMAVLGGVVAGVTVSTLNKNTDKTALGEIGTLASALDAYLSAEAIDKSEFSDTVTAWINEYNGEHPGTLVHGSSPKAGEHKFQYVLDGDKITFSFTPKSRSSKSSRTYTFNESTHSIVESTAAAAPAGGTDNKPGTETKEPETPAGKVTQ